MIQARYLSSLSCAFIPVRSEIPLSFYKKILRFCLRLMLFERKQEGSGQYLIISYAFSSLWLVDLLIKSREHERGDLCSVPTSMLGWTLKRGQFSEARLEDESLLLALPKEVFVFFGERTQVHILLRILVDDVLGVNFDCLSISEQPWPECGPVGMENLLLRHVGAVYRKAYSKTQSSYWSISFMQGVVSRVGGTEAGTFPKYRNDIN